jgi:general secretion pathway protein B
MSYILDALKKAERERQRGAVPTISVDLAEPTPVKRPAYGLYVGVAVALLIVGVAIGTYRPLSHGDAPVGTPATAVPAVGSQPAPTIAAEKHAIRPVAHSAAPAIEKPAAVQAAAPQPSAAQASPASVPVQAKAAPVAVPPEAKPAEPAESQPWALADLPINVQQEIPAMNVMFHAYSSDPAQRLVEVNGKPMHEGDALAAGLKLEKITQDGMVFSYKGYRFKTGVR